MKKSENKTAERMAALRALLKKQGMSGYIVPRQDEFQGEYVDAYAERLKWLTGFAGSWGLAIITTTKAAIFVDGRYTVQVREQVDTNLIQPQHLVDEPPTGWISQNLKKGDKLGFDPWLITASDAKRYAKACEAVGAKLVPTAKNLIDKIWDDQPAPSGKPLSVQPLQFAGRSVADKLADMAAALKKTNADAAVLAEPSSVSWVLNLRGADVPYTPVVLAYAILHKKGKAELFIDKSRLPEDVRAHLKATANVRAPADLTTSLKALGKKQAKVQIDQGSAPELVRGTLKAAGATIIEAQDPCTMPKARKNLSELNGARAAQLRDGAALSRYLHWLSVEAPKGHLTEATAANQLLKFRQDTGVLLDLSFSSISAAGPNAAIPHYHVDPANCLPIKNNEIYLIDSGGQYQDGTTDVTRTIIVGKPTDEMMDRFTRVLKGMIGISCAQFPAGTTGTHIDAFARQALWQAGLDFDHGTGHGVGSYLSVHEGPARISKANYVPLQPGMILSNEPGYYKAGHFGIRIENLLIVKEPANIQGGERPMMSFETLTFAPIDRNLIDVKLLSPDELQWLNAYHAKVLADVGSQMTGDAAEWMKQACAPL
ncbi:MAG: aminopeptidase P family protein [Alphaproteobacteria bacterium]|nr:aminopeptidase P family protein [Alphaproteobacteria bacterium]